MDPHSIDLAIASPIVPPIDVSSLDHTGTAAHDPAAE
jgi:hypothetical protein